MTENSILAYAQSGSDFCKFQPLAEPKINNLSSPRGNISRYEATDGLDCLFVGPIFIVIFLAIGKIALSNAVMYPAIADVIETAIAHCLEKIAFRRKKIAGACKQRGKHIMDNVAGEIIIMDNYGRHA